MQLARLWILAAVAGILGALVLFDALPGINWTLWALVVAAGLVAYRRPDRASARALALPLGFAIVLAIGASITSAPLLLLAIFAIVASLLALAVLLTRDATYAATYGAAEIVTAPFRALGQTISGALRAISTTVDSAGAMRASPTLRGALIATPVVIAFALLFATADPLFARGRDAVLDALATWAVLPRVIFGVVLGVFVLGAYTASLATPSSTASTTRVSSVRLGLTERRIVLAATAAISWLFVLLQLSYLFGTAPAVVGSGMTFAEYAHRGFGELAIAATVAALLIVAAESGVASSDGRDDRRVLVLPALALLAAVGCILVSAFHRITVYEDAYGYTTMRVYVQAYLMMTLVILAALAWQVLRAFDVRALARHVMAVALLTLTALVYWNGDAWVANANIDRFAQSGKLDVSYLTRGLSPDAYPAITESLVRVAEPQRTQLASALAQVGTSRHMLTRAPHWYEWNSRRAAARRAVLALSAAQR